MSWYYAENNERRGPIDDAEFDSLVARGSVRPETLVWRDGMANWSPLSQSGYAPRGPQPPAVPGASPAPAGVEMGVCSESGRTLPRSELVEIDGKLVSAEFKNVVLQRIREGVGGGGAATDPDVIAQQIERRGYNIDAGDCIRRGFTLIKDNFWLTVGSTFLSMLVSQAAGMVPLVGPIVVFGPLTAGLYWLMIRLLRKEPANVGDAFAGFTRSFGHLVGVGAIMFVIIIACMIPAIVAFVAVAAMSSGGHAGSQPPAGLITGFLIAGACGLVGFLAMIYFWVSWLFSFGLVIDKGLEFWPAMKLSRRVVKMHWWQVFWLVFLTGLIMLGVIFVGMLLFGAGAAVFGGKNLDPGAAAGLVIAFGLVFVCILLAIMPLSYAAVAVAYEDIFGPKTNR
jgi:hypothetical protein